MNKVKITIAVEYQDDVLLERQYLVDQNDIELMKENMEKFMTDTDSYISEITEMEKEIDY